MDYSIDEEVLDKYIVYRDGREVFVVTEENIKDIRIIPVDIILPAHWKKKTRYRLRVDYEILGTLIPKNYVSDGASVPRIFWSLYPPAGRYLLAAFLHDWKLDQLHGWNESNAAFDRALRAIEISARRRFVIMRAVETYGWIRTRFFNEP